MPTQASPSLGVTPSPDVPARNRTLTKSHELLARARRVIPGASQTFSKGPSQFVQGVAPVFLERGKGARVWDVDGNEYLDFGMALGPILLGYDFPAVVAAVNAQAARGASFSLPHPLEVDVAETLVDLIPCAEMVRFGKNGSDVTTAAVRLARAYTGRDMIACSGYHGWHDWYVGTTTRSKGVPAAVAALTVPFEYGSLESLREVFTRWPDRVAAVILEPIGVNEPPLDYLAELASLVHAESALLIFDEVVTGFRLAIGGAQEHFGVTPDLACFGKGMGNGYPIAALTGRADVMRQLEEVFVSSTFGGETVSLAASAATLAELRTGAVVPHLWTLGRRLRDEFNALVSELGAGALTECVGLPPRTVIGFSGTAGVSAAELKTFFQQECLKRGLLFTAAHNMCFSHTAEDVDEALAVYRTVVRKMVAAVRSGTLVNALEGDVIQPVFRRP